jgi:P-type conjugative transfer protein TrbJ
MKKLVLTLALLTTSIGAASRAQAQWAVFDASTFGQTLSTAINTANQVRQLAQQLTNMRDQLKYQIQSLQTIDPRTFDGAMALFNQGRFTYDTFTNNAQSLGYSVGLVNQGYRRLFPDKSAITKASPSGYDQMYSLWQTQLQGSAQTAMLAQANAAQLQQNNFQIQAILTASKGANAADAQAVVKQLQAIVQMLAVIQSQLVTLTQTISTAERVNSEMAAASATEKIAAGEAAAKSRQNYKATGQPPRVLRRLP